MMLFITNGLINSTHQRLLEMHSYTIVMQQFLALHHLLQIAFAPNTVQNEVKKVFEMH